MLRLSTSTCGPLPVALRPLTGEDERALAASGEGMPSFEVAVRLVRGLLRDAPNGALTPARLAELSVHDFDRILAELHRRLYGERMECRIACTACDEPLEFQVTLDELAAPPSEPASVTALPDRAGHFQLADGTVFRLPTVAHVLAGATRAQVLDDCLSAEGGATGAHPPASADLEAAFATAGPVACDIVESVCPACDAAQSARVDLGDYLLGMLGRERAFLLRETHVLARAYGWRLTEILGLSRDDRRVFVRLVDADAAAQARAARRIA